MPGYASIVVSILIMGGLQRLAMGIMSEYLGRVLLNVKSVPQYVERCVVGASHQPADACRARAGNPQVGMTRAAHG